MTIVMYGADWCGDCRRAEKFFVDNKINFQKVDLELDENEHFVESEVFTQVGRYKDCSMQFKASSDKIGLSASK